MSAAASPPELESYFEVIHAAFEALPVSYSSELWCEPGRALCAEYASVLVRVEKRRGDELYINDGAYGALFDAAHVGWRYPVALVRATDSGDYIEIGMLGAYGCAMRTGFNGFGAVERVIVDDEPMTTMYAGAERTPTRSNVVTL